MASVRKVPCVRPGVGRLVSRRCRPAPHFESPRRQLPCLTKSTLTPNSSNRYTTRCAFQHPDWVEANGSCPTCDSHESLLAELLGLSHQTTSAIPSVAASEAIREIAWESDRQFA